MTIAAVGATYVLHRRTRSFSRVDYRPCLGRGSDCAARDGQHAAGICRLRCRGCAVGAINASAVAYLNLTPFLITLALLLAARALAFLLTASVLDRTIVGGSSIGGLPAGVRALGDRQVGAVPLIALIALLVVCVSSLVLHRTRFGRSVMLVGSNVNAAERSGIHVRRIKWAVYTLAGVAAGIAAIAAIASTLRFNSGNPAVGDGLLSRCLAQSCWAEQVFRVARAARLRHSSGHCSLPCWSTART